MPTDPANRRARPGVRAPWGRVSRSSHGVRYFSRVSALYTVQRPQLSFAWALDTEGTRRRQTPDRCSGETRRRARGDDGEAWRSMSVRAARVGAGVDDEARERARKACSPQRSHLTKANVRWISRYSAAAELLRGSRVAMQGMPSRSGGAKVAMDL